MLLTLAQIKPKSFESRRNSLFYPGWMRLMFVSIVILVPTLRASLSGTFLQTLPDLVTLLKVAGCSIAGLRNTLHYSWL